MDSQGTKCRRKMPKIATAWVGCTSVTDDRRQMDGRQQLANVNVSSRSLKMDVSLDCTVSSTYRLSDLSRLIACQCPQTWTFSFCRWCQTAKYIQVHGCMMVGIRNIAWLCRHHANIRVALSRLAVYK